MEQREYNTCSVEIFHAMKRRGQGKDGTIALKLYVSKAYDRVEWSFLKRLMFKIGFSGEWLPIECVVLVQHQWSD